MKVLWHSHAPWSPTGYGTQTATVTPLLQQSNDVAISCCRGLTDSSLGWGGMRVYPPIFDPLGNDAIAAHAEHHFGARPGIVITMMDVFPLDPVVYRDLNHFAWVPVDHTPVPESTLAFLRDSGAVPVAMSKFGERMLAELDPLYVPLSVDTSVFRPRDRSVSRARIGVPDDAFVVGVVAANLGKRKCLPESLDAFARFALKRKDAHLYLHTDVMGAREGINLLALLADLGVRRDQVTFADQYAYHVMPVDQDQMAHTYSAMNVLLAASAGEGFGLPIVEAQACGTPAISTDFSSMPEVTGAGWTVDGTRQWTNFLSWQSRPSVDRIVWALGDAYDRADGMREQAREFAARYDSKTVVAEHLLPAIDAAWQRMAQPATVLA